MGLGQGVEMGRADARLELRFDEGQDLGHDAPRAAHRVDLDSRLEADGHQLLGPRDRRLGRGQQRGGHGADRLPAVDRAQQAPLAVVADDVVQGCQLGGQAGGDRLAPVVLALDQGRVVEVALARDPGRMAGLVVDMAVGLADPAPGQAPDELGLGDLDLEGDVDLAVAVGQGRGQDVGLGQVAREAVEDRADGRVRLGQPVEEHLDRDRVGHQLAALHVPPGLEADGRAFVDGRAEEVSGRNVREAESVRKDRCLGTLAGAGGAQQDQEGHRMKPS